MGSQLQTIQQEILRRFQRPPSTSDIPGYAGGNLGDQLDSDAGMVRNGERDAALRRGREDIASPDRMSGQMSGRSAFAPQPTPQPSVSTPPRNDDRPVAGDAPPPRSMNPFLPPSLPNDLSVMNPDAVPVGQPSRLSQAGTPPPQMSWNPLRYKPSGEPEVSPTAKGNQLDIATQKRDAYQAWKPQGHRGVKQVLKEGVIGAANAVNANPNNPWAAVGGFGAGAGSGVVQPNVITRNFELNKSNQYVNRMLAEQHARNTVDNAGMVPVTLNDGRTVMVPRAKAADMESKQQTIAQGEARVKASSALAKAHADRWDRMDKHLAAQEAQSLYNSGAADNDPELLAEVGKRMGMSKAPGPHTAGDIKLNENGEYVLINKKSGDVTETNQESYVPTQEKNKTERAKLQITAADARQQAQILATNSRDAANRGDRQNARQLDRQAKGAALYGQYLGGVEMSRDSDPATAAKGKAIMKAQRGALQGYGDLYGVDKDGNVTQKETVAPQSASPTQSQKGAWNPKRFAAAFQAKHGRPPTQTEIDTYAKAAQQ